MASELTEAQLIDKVDDLNGRIDAAMATSASSVFKYKIGDIEVDKTAYVAHLTPQRDYYQKELRLVQCASADLMTAPDYEISEFGEVLGQEVDED